MSITGFAKQDFLFIFLFIWLRQSKLIDSIKLHDVNMLDLNP